MCSDFDSLGIDGVAVSVKMADSGRLFFHLILLDAPVGLVPLHVGLVLAALRQEEVVQELVNDSSLALTNLVLLLARVLALLILVHLAVECAVVLFQRFNRLDCKNLCWTWSKLETRQLIEFLNKQELLSGHTKDTK